MSKLVERECPLCRSDYLLKFKDPGFSYQGYLYCPECDTLFRPNRGGTGELMAMVKTIKPYDDFRTFLKGWDR